MLVGVALQDGMEQVEIPENEILRFPRGVIGFDELTRYALFQLEHPLFLLQAIDDPHVGFVMLDPFLLDPSYSAELPPEDRSLLAMGDGEQAVLLAVVTLSSDGAPLTANLRAPIAINPTSMVGIQAILTDNRYPVRYPITELPDAPLALHRGTSHKEDQARANGQMRRLRSA